MRNKLLAMYRHSRTVYVAKVLQEVELGGEGDVLVAEGVDWRVCPGRSKHTSNSTISRTTRADIRYSSDTPTKTKKSTKTKVQRKWGDEAPSESDMASLDFSYVQVDSPSQDRTSMDLSALVDQASMGTRTSEGMYEVKDWEFDNPESATAAAAAAASTPASSGSSLGALGSLFSRITGTKTLTQADLAPVLEGMKQHLMKKNVAKEIAEKVVEGVGEDLIGRRITGWGGTNTAVRNALSASLTRILTPKTSTDLLLSIRTKLTEGQSSMISSAGKKEPYSIVFVGVNGVGKSTNLSKVCFWLVQNGMRVLIAACDTFRCVIIITLLPYVDIN